MSDNMIQVMLIQPMRRPVMVEIENKLAAMQKLVEGRIEEYMPFEDDVAIVCNDEGKINGALPNRGIYDEKGELQDIIFGSFFLCNAPPESEHFLSLTKTQQEKYMEYFKSPEHFFKTEEGIIVRKVAIPEKAMER